MKGTENERRLARLKRKLILAYTVTAGAILTLVVTVAFFYMQKNKRDEAVRVFENNVFQVVSKLREGKLEHNWLARQQNINRLIIYVEDQGKPLKLLGTAKQEELKNVLVQRLRERCVKEKLDFSVRPVSQMEKSSGIYWLEDDEGESYLGKAYVFQGDNGFVGTMVFEWQQGDAYQEMQETGMFVLADLLGILFLGLTGYFFVNRSLRPVEEARRKQSAFIAAASHELRSPLAVLRANVSACRTLPERREDCFLVMEKECERMAGLVEDLLVLSHADARSRKSIRKAVDMEALLIQLFEGYEPLCRERGRLLRLELPEEELWVVLGESERLKQILAVFLENAIRFSNEGGVIVLRARQRHKHRRRLLIEVEDHGCGVPVEEKERVFDRFYQADASRGEKEHFGLGLSIARELAQENGGKVFCMDTQGGGATFCLEIGDFLEKNLVR